METQTPVKFIKRISGLEKELQRLKVESFFSMPTSKKQSLAYPAKQIFTVLKKTRSDIWKKRYAPAG